jgi:hypothetical protein
MINNSRLYITMLKVIAESYPLPQAFFDNPNRSFYKLNAGEIDENGEPILVDRDPTNTTIITGLEATRETSGMTRVLNIPNGEGSTSEFIICGVPNLTQAEIDGIREMREVYGDMGFKVIRNHPEAKEFINAGVDPSES